MTWPLRLAAMVALAIGIGCGLGAWHIWSDNARMVRVGVEVQGRMTGAYREVQGRGGSSLYPTVSYRTREGRLIIGQVEHAVDRADIESNRVVALLYDPDDSQRVDLAATVAAGAGVLPWLLAGLGLAVAELSAMALLRRWRAMRGRP
ncbi:DUF3592 domain-containing protein [Plastoroseomonas arctica]|uniref:DUF3592 domain-containing protein n=1 Tax=Plastoroseomonas arctica TaxID=1509237 RepID=A0AAF1KH62_9PROT|nr:DUF3592 domain-containing protein [Plastoroseomonas arctica]MBR0653504.1 DUF3592 domain-containing protein [Plastoroseomonas arctica]